MLAEKLKDYQLILASGSPRRQNFLREMGLDFEIKLHPIEEVYPETLKAEAITDYLSKLKAEPFNGKIETNQIIITSDTIVWHNNKTLGKPISEKDAFKMLRTLSNDWHQVITSVCFTTTNEQKIVNCTTKVKLAELTDDEIQFYITAYQPMDKAGSYGIQEWFGLIAVEEIQGSYTNIVGLPTQLVYNTLMDIVK